MAADAGAGSVATRAGRARLARNTLSRRAVVSQAIDLIERDGPESLTIGALARELGSAPGAIYRHVSSRQDLIGAIAEEFFRMALAEYRPSGAWEADLMSLGMSLWQASDAHPALAAVCYSRGTLGEMESFAVDAILVCVVDAGWDGRDAALRYWTFASFILATSALHASRVMSGEDAAQFADRVVDAARFPHVAAALPDIRSVADIDAFRFGLETLVAALRR